MSRRRRHVRRGQSTNLAGFVVCLVFVLAVVVFLDTNVFIVKRITITGNKTVSNEDIIDISGIDYGQRLFSINLDAVRERFDHKGGIKNVSVGTDWPDGVTIEVEQRTVAAMVEYLGTKIIVDENAYVMQMVNEMPTIMVPVVTGVDIVSLGVGDILACSKPRQASDLANLLNGLIEWGMLENISEISLSDPDGVYLVTRGGMIVTLGDTLLIDDKLMWMKNVMDQLATQGVYKGKLDVTSGDMAVYSE